jgi:hypothetical protein
MASVLTYAEAKAAVAAAVADQGNIRENLVELDRSFGKRVLEGANLAGETKQCWTAAAAELTAVWQLFDQYSAVVDRAVEITGRFRKPGPRLAEVTELLAGKSVRLAATRSPHARRDLTDGSDGQLTVAEAVEEMKHTFADVAGVVNSVASVWNQVGDQLQQVQTDLAQARQQAAGFNDGELTTALAVAEQDLGDLQELLNCDPLALWHDGAVDVRRFDELAREAAVVTSRARELAGLREDADGRIGVTAAAVAAAERARQDALAAWQRSGAKILVSAVPGLPEVASLADRMAALDKLKAAGRWTRLSSELDVIDQQAAAVAEQCRQAERAAAALLDRRDELRGLLDAYRARAAKLGAAENRDLEERHQRARGLLWTAPCDLSAAADAVTSFQQAVLAIAEKEKERRS